MRWLLVAITVVGCSSRPEHRDTTAGNASPAPIDAAAAPADAVTRAVGPLAAGCPATFAAAAATGGCSAREACAYPEGDCYCSSPPSCGGAYMPPRPPVWQCTPLVRADGCPGVEPADGAPCTRDGQSCDYTCSCLETATCSKGVWATASGPCKP